MKKHLLKRLLSLVLAVVLCVGAVLPAAAAGTSGGCKVAFEKVDNGAVSERLSNLETVTEAEQPSLYGDTDVVRVSIVLRDQSTLETAIARGVSTKMIASDATAMSYRSSLERKQDAMAQTISTQALGGKKLDVVWNLTLAANIISANVEYGKIEAIEAVPGVEGVYVERQYAPAVASVDGDTAHPEMYTSSGMIGSNAAWADGYTGAGSRIAVIDTGTDTDHQSFSYRAFQHALEENAKDAGMTYDEYTDSLDLLDAEEISEVLGELHVKGVTARDLYRNLKLAYGYNYVDEGLDITHDNDSQGGHGSHVAGIAASNRFIETAEDVFEEASTTVYTNGVAPDAQLITMKVFGQSGGAYDSDYMAAIEDAIVLKCDAVNLSLGSATAGSAFDAVYADVLDRLATTDTVVVISAGNAGYWAESAGSGGLLYDDGVNFDTVGSPGSYTNSLSVASVDNKGSVSLRFTVDGKSVYYTETSYTNKPMASLDTSSDGAGTELAYIFVTGVGNASDYAGMDLTGKVVFCARGETSFFEKGNVAAGKGAAAVVVYNNTAGSISMDLSGYGYTAPCVSITQEDAAMIREASAEAVTADSLTYYTGTLKVFAEPEIVLDDSEYMTMSSFSSWGVPGDLSMKPEITAPGGSIYSVDGASAGTDNYVIMSGTSMAAPQVTGMAALTAQYIKENGLAEKTKLSVRQLSQSLLMSTAVPLFEEAAGGSYYSVLVQGAGLANVNSVLNAGTYVLVDGQPDGKVKAELGDDPDHTGEYSFSFSLNNLTDEAVDYGLRADVFTQDLYEHTDGTMYLDTWTKTLEAETSFSVDGALVMTPAAAARYDMNGDGQADEADADYLLSYLLGNETEIHAEPDVNGDGTVNAYDAHVLLTLIQGAACVTVPGNGSVKVDVTIKLPAQVKAYLDENYPAGAYVEAFVYAESVADAEGSQGVTHSIPVLGFYGSWTDSSMYDVGTPVERSYGLESRNPYLGVLPNNFFSIKYAGDRNEYIYGGNPLVQEDTYLPARNAFNNTSGDTFSRLYYGLIRNAGSVMLRISNAETGAEYLKEVKGETNAAYYYTNAGAWYDTQRKQTLNWKGTDANGDPLPEGTAVNISLIAAPEYYQNADGTYNWDALGEGAFLTMQTTIDNTAPEIKDVEADLENKTLHVQAVDNQYIAAVGLFNRAGTALKASATPNQTVAGETQDISLSLEGLSGSSFLVKVYDYAMNATTYQLVLDENLNDMERPYFTAINRTDADDNFYLSWVGFDEEEGAAPVHLGTIFNAEVPRAAEYVNGYVFEAGNDGALLVANDNDLDDFLYLCQMAPEDHGAILPIDMAYNMKDENLYLMFYSDKNNKKVPYLATVDMLLGTVNVLGAMGKDFNNMAIDGDGNFYSTVYNSATLYTYTADTFALPTEIGSTGFSTKSVNTMAWDHNTGKLYWSYTGNGSYGLYEVNTETAELKLVRSLPASMVGLYTRPETPPASDMFKPTEDIVRLDLNYEEVNIYVDESVAMSCTVWPWTVSDHSVTWSVDNPEIASISAGGLLTGLSEGSTTLTATSKLDPTKSVSCEVNVFGVTAVLTGALMDADGTPQTFSWDLTQNETWQPGVKLSTNIISGSYDAAHDAAYIMDSTGSIHKIDAATGETLDSTSPKNNDAWDMAFSEAFGEEALYGVVDATLLTPAEYTDSSFGLYGFPLSQNLAVTGASRLVAIASGGKLEDNNEFVYALDDAGYIWVFWITLVDGEYKANVGAFPTGLSDFDVDFPGYDGYPYCSLVEDHETGILFLSCFNGETNELYMLGYNGEGFDVLRIGDVGSDVWPATLFTGKYLYDSETTAALDKQEIQSSGMQLTATRIAAPAAAGSLHAAPAAQTENTLKSQARPLSNGSYYNETNTLSVSVTASEATVSGRFTVSYDASQLSLLSVSSPVQASANRESAAAVEVAYASAAPVEKDGVLAVLTFQCADTLSGDVELTVKTTELNNQRTDTTETITIPVDHTHDWSEWTVAREATCTEPGEETRTCAICNDTETREIPAHGHGAFYYEGQKMPTLTQNGYSGDKYCGICGVLVEEGHVIPATGSAILPVVPSVPSGGSAPAAENELPFTDVSKNAPYYDAVKYVYENDLMNGTSATKFTPDGTLNRAMVVTILHRLEGEPAVAYTGKFADVADGLWYTAGVEWAAKNGIVTGYTTGNFGPTDSVTCEQLAAILYRYAQYKNYDVSSAASLSGYADSASVSAYAVPAVQWAVAMDMISASGGKLQPREAATRAQVAVAVACFHRTYVK